MLKRSNIQSSTSSDLELLLLVGPSCAGKSTVFNSLKKRNIENISLISLDVIAGNYAKQRGIISKNSTLKKLMSFFKQDVELFFKFGLQALESHCRVMNIRGRVLVDVGAGFCSGRLATLWVRSCPSILINVSPFVGYERYNSSRQQSIAFPVYRSTQFSIKRTKVYRSCQHSIDTTFLSVAEVENAVVKFFNLSSSWVGGKDD